MLSLVREGGKLPPCRIINSWQDQTASGLESAYRELQPSQLLRAAIPRNRDLGRGQCWDTLGPLLQPGALWVLLSGGEKKSPAQREALLVRALSVLSVYLSVCVSFFCASFLSAPVACMCVCVCACVCVHVCVCVPTRATARFIMSHACMSVNVDSVTHWASHTIQNKRLPPRITIDPCGALSCIWKEREWERDYTTSPLSPSLSRPVFWGMLCVCLSAEKV